MGGVMVFGATAAAQTILHALPLRLLITWLTGHELTSKAELNYFLM